MMCQYIKHINYATHHDLLTNIAICLDLLLHAGCKSSI